MVSTLTKNTNYQTAPLQRAGEKWIYGAWTDILLLHGFFGLITIPLAIAAFIASDSWTPILVTYGFCLGMPHLVATHVRLNLDSDCKTRFRWLAHGAPVLIILSLFSILLTNEYLLPYIVMGWFVAQTFHANAQNYGIMRRYVRMSGHREVKAVDKAAEALIQIIPWTFVTTCMLQPATSFLGYKIILPPGELMIPICIALWTVTLPIFLCYFVLEARALIKKDYVPGRILCVISGLFVNTLAWLVVREVHWGYLIVSTWHSLQYIAYVHAFRRKPPPGLNPVKLTAVKHISLLLVIGAAVTSFLWQLQAFLPLVVVAIHIGMNFHHYLSDMLIWRRPPVKDPAIV